MRNTYRQEDGKIIIGVALPIFIHNVSYHLTEIQIFQDGKIDCWGLVDFDGFIGKLKQGWLQTTIPNNEKVFAFPLGNFEVSSFAPQKNSEELIKEVRDILERLNSRPTSDMICEKAFKAYISNPTVENETQLRMSYENVPIHNRRFILGDMDVDDIPIRVVLYGEEEFNKSQKAQLQKKYISQYYLKKTP